MLVVSHNHALPPRHPDTSTPPLQPAPVASARPTHTLRHSRSAPRSGHSCHVHLSGTPNWSRPLLLPLVHTSCATAHSAPQSSAPATPGSALHHCTSPAARFDTVAPLRSAPETV